MFQRFSFHDEIFLEEEKTDDGEEVDENQRKYGCQQDRAAVSCDATNNIK